MKSHTFVYRADHDLCSECGETLANGNHRPQCSPYLDLSGLSKEERNAIELIVMGLLNEKTLKRHLEEALMKCTEVSR